MVGEGEKQNLGGGGAEASYTQVGISPCCGGNQEGVGGRGNRGRTVDLVVGWGGDDGVLWWLLFPLRGLRPSYPCECSVKKLTPGSFSPLTVTHQEGMRGINWAFVFEA